MVGLRNWPGRIAEACGDLAAIEKYRRLSNSNDLGTSKAFLLILGQTALQLGRLKKAEIYLGEYPGSDDESPLTDWGHTNAFQALANFLRRLGRLQQAARYADLSIESLEAQVDKLGGSQEDKGKFRGRNGDIYRDALRLKLELGRPQEAFHLLERFRAQAFLILLAERDLALAGDVPPELDQERRPRTSGPPCSSSATGSSSFLAYSLTLSARERRYHRQEVVEG